MALETVWDPKDPDELLDYKIDWTKSLDGDEIEDSVWEIPEGIVMESNLFETSKTTIWLSGGTLGMNYELTNRITTAGGRVRDQSVKLKVRKK